MRKIFFSVFSFIIVFIINSAWAEIFVGEVVKMRGDVSQLSPGSLEARKVFLGDKLIEDTSVLTGNRSFVKIKFNDNSELNLGPDSKIVISEMKINSPGVITLLKGKMRTAVEKSADNNSNKFFVKTRTAAMGVRGTEFQTIFNPENKMTSLLTYKGEVAMAKIEEDKFHQLDNRRKVIRNEENNGVTVENENIDNSLTEAQELGQLLENKKTSIIPSGQNSFVNDNLKKTSLPVKISPIQLNVLYRNKEFAENTGANVRPIEEKDLKKMKLELKAQNQMAPPEGIYDRRSGDFAPRAGGLIDMETGLYIAPSSDAKFNEDEKIYETQAVGNIDRETGNFVIPKGIKLDASKGFIALDSSNSEPQYLALRDDLNKAVNRDIIFSTLKKENKNEFNLYEKFIRDEVYLSTVIGGQTLNLNSKAGTSSEMNLTAGRDKIRGAVEWRIAATGRFRPLLGALLSNVNFKGSMPDSFSTESRKVFGVYLGGMYGLNRFFDLYSKIGLLQDHYINRSSTTLNYTLMRVVTTKWFLGLNSEFFRESYFPLIIDGYGFLNFRKRLNTIKVKDGVGWGMSIGSTVKLSDRSYLGYGYWQESQKVDVETENGEYEHHRSDGGLRFQYIMRF